MYQPCDSVMLIFDFRVPTTSPNCRNCANVCRQRVQLYNTQKMCCGSKCIEFGSGSRILAQFRSGSDPGPDPDPVLCYQFWKKFFKTILEKNNFINKSKFFNKKCQLKKCLVSWSTGLLIYILIDKSHTFCLYFILFLHVGILIRIPNTDPDPQSSWIQIQ